MGKLLRLVAVLLLVITACGGGDEDGTTTTSVAAGSATTIASSTTTADPAPGASDDFCMFVSDYADNTDFSPVGMSPSEIEATFRGSLDAINEAASLAPGAIRSDVEMLGAAYAGFVDFLAEHGFNFLAIPEDALNDPRMAALDDPELTAAGDRIAEYCGLDSFISSAPSPDPGTGGTVPGGGIPGSELPENFPADLEPPGGEVVATVTVAAGTSVTFTTTTAFEDVLAYYVDVLGPATQTLDPNGALWVMPYEGRFLNLVINETEGGVTEINVTTT